MTQQLDIDFVSDVACPWCAVGLYSLEEALRRLGDAVSVRVRFRPFELDPDVGPEGEATDEYLARKYGASSAQLQMAREAIAQRGAGVGFVFDLDKRKRVFNTFDAHRLMHWAGQAGRQRELAGALFKAYFTDGENPGDHAVLIRLADEAGLDCERARAILASGEFAGEVREMEAWNQRSGIHAVPAVIVSGKYLIQGGEPPEVFEQALRKIIAQ
jgi:predicted DsbA family dithiol-disulfide isomerase